METLTIYLEGNKRSPLRLLFSADTALKRKKSKDSPHWEVGYPEDGVLWKTGGFGESVNLNRPGVVAQFILYARQHGWHPEDARKPYLVADGFDWLETIEFPAPASGSSGQM